MLSRNSRTALGDARSLPFIRDLVEFGTSKARPTDIIVLTNDDTFFCSGLTYLILNRVPWCGAAFAFRWDFKRLARLDRPEIREGRKNMGADLFAFTGKWWLDHGNEYPDMLLGCETWDWIMRELIRLRGGVELFECIFHEKHSAFWAMHRLENVGNRHNRALACAWLHEHSLPCSIGSYSILNTE
jgi:hypothetical protein